ncbi:MAG: TetR/AcrR family transcriptional regulator [Actinomycetaceae bacterium]|nr:TetR/AcrR family transcriptional regulator [Actinomycetaceae bacterium]
MARPAQPIPDHRQRRLLSVAAKEFDKGYAEASLNKILKEAGFSKSSFYHYYSNKEELFDMVAAVAVTNVMSTIPLPQPEQLDASTYADQIARTIHQLSEAIYPGSAAHWLSTVVLLNGEGMRGTVAQATELIRAWLRQMCQRAIDLELIENPLSIDLMSSYAETLIHTTISWVIDNPDQAADAWATIERIVRKQLTSGQ